MLTTAWVVGHRRTKAELAYLNAASAPSCRRSRFATYLPTARRRTIRSRQPHRGRGQPPNDACAGDQVGLSKKQFVNYMSTLRAFARLLADAVSNLPGAS